MQNDFSFCSIFIAMTSSNFYRNSIQNHRFCIEWMVNHHSFDGRLSLLLDKWGCKAKYPHCSLHRRLISCFFHSEMVYFALHFRESGPRRPRVSICILPIETRGHFQKDNHISRKEEHSEMLSFRFGGHIHSEKSVIAFPLKQVIRL